MLFVMNERKTKDSERREEEEDRGDRRGLKRRESASLGEFVW